MHGGVCCARAQVQQGDCAGRAAPSLRIPVRSLAAHTTPPQVLGSLEEDFVWIHDYHLLVLPSLLRKRFHRIKWVAPKAAARLRDGRRLVVCVRP